MTERKSNKELKKVSNITIEDAVIGFRNFSGKEGKYNVEGSRNFVVFLETAFAKKLEEDGWNIRWLDPKDKDDEPHASLSVKVAFGEYPPKVVLISEGQTSSKKTSLDEASIHILDWAEIKTVDLIIRPYNYTIPKTLHSPEKSGIKAYLKTLYVTIIPDIFEEKYETTPDSAKAAVFDN